MDNPDDDDDGNGNAHGTAIAAGNAMESAILSLNTKKIYASKYLFFKNYMQAKHPHTYDAELSDINPRLFTAELAKEFFGYVSVKRNYGTDAVIEPVQQMSFNHVSSFRSAIKSQFDHGSGSTQ